MMLAESKRKQVEHPTNLKDTTILKITHYNPNKQLNPSYHHAIISYSDETQILSEQG